MSSCVLNSWIVRFRLERFERCGEMVITTRERRPLGNRPGGRGRGAVQFMMLIMSCAPHCIRFYGFDV